ncbi:MAG: hypothetical protein JWR67_1033, partial [Mucilaginibacter sp.]|nr:hypothetical protein [Mucilaginibacter sp.]
ASNLKYGYQDKEKHLYLANDKNGRNFGSVWIKKQSPISN